MDVGYRYTVRVLRRLKWIAWAAFLGLVAWGIAYHTPLSRSAAPTWLLWTVAAVVLATLVLVCVMAMRRLWQGFHQERADRLAVQEELGRRNRQLLLLSQASAAFSSTLDVGQVLASVLEEVRRLLEVVACSIWLIDLESGELVCHQATGPQSELVLGWRLEADQGVVGWVVQTGESLIVSDVQTDERHFKGVDQATGLALRSILSAPLRIQDQVIGVLQVVDSIPGRFDQADLALLEPLASSAAIAVRNARLYDAERKRAAQLALVSRVSQQAASILDPEQLLREIVVAIRQAFNYYAVAILQLDHDRGVLYAPVCSGEYEEFVAPDYVQPLGTGVMGWVARTGQPMLVNDVSKEPLYITVTENSLPTQSELCLPLVVVERIIGVLDVQNKEVNSFDGTDLAAMQTLADQIAIAIENARLYEQTRRDGQTKAALLQEVYHRVKNNLQIISSLLDLQSESITDPLSLRAFRDSQNRVRSMALIHEMLYQSPDPANIDMGDYVRREVDYLLAAYQGWGVGGIELSAIAITIAVDHVALDLDRAIPCGLIINELVSNALKHAFPIDGSTHGDGGPEISVQLSREGGLFLLAVSDNGVGLPGDLDWQELPSLGLQLVQILAEQIDAEVRIIRDGGATFQFVFAKEPARSR